MIFMFLIVFVTFLCFFFFFKQKTAYEMRISDWSSDVCSSDLSPGEALGKVSAAIPRVAGGLTMKRTVVVVAIALALAVSTLTLFGMHRAASTTAAPAVAASTQATPMPAAATDAPPSTQARSGFRSEEHTSALQSLMRTSYAALRLK